MTRRAWCPTGIYIVPLLLITFCGCGSQRSDDWLTAADWARAKGGMWFKMKIEGSTGKNFLDLRLVSKDEDPSSSGGSSGWKNGTIVKVILWKEDDRMHCAIIAESPRNPDGGVNRFRSSVALPKDMDKSALVKENGSQIKVGEIFRKYSAGSITVAPSQELNEGEYGLKFDWSEGSHDSTGDTP